VQARIAAEEALSQNAADASAAGRRLDEAREARVEAEQKLAALRPKARRRLVAAVGIAVLLAFAAWLAPSFERSTAPRVGPSASGEGVALRLEYRLNTLKDQ
jgi:hypothetical protein